ncbi:toxin-antitoxin system YwqK family antitoxin [Marinigracilibium pacificum]|uniref:MORN repeat protein n=1 Tax=Marinigracilibium pacificum TaxID=2729599 RepID=A0A848IXN2_9BACT|nr:hypothetical protein [Marinigracilibium pacificum]NMM47928.1 hypothetical protein [Marinigracilibium pacificum]
MKEKIKIQYKIILSLTLLLVVLSGCFKTIDNRQNDLLLYKEDTIKLEARLFENGDTAAIISYLDSSETKVKHGFVKDFYRNGNLKGIHEFNKGNKDGGFETYYENGNLREKGKYRNGKLDSLYNSYYENGNPKGTFLYLEDNFIGECISYYENGSVKDYGFYIPNGELVFSVNYDINGNIVNENGEKIMLFNFGKKNLSYEVGEELNLSLYIPNPPDKSFKLNTKIENSSGEIIYDNDFTETRNGIVKIKHTLLEKGHHHVILNAHYFVQDSLFDQIDETIGFKVIE